MVLLLSLMEQLAAPGGGGGGFAQQGGPWEFNLRDLLRWCLLAEAAAAATAMTAGDSVASEGDPFSAMDVDGTAMHPAAAAVAASAVPVEAAVEAAVLHFSHMLFLHRFRTPRDRHIFRRLLSQAWGGSGALLANRDDNDEGEEDGEKLGGSCVPWDRTPSVLVSTEVVVVGRARLPRAMAPMPAMQASLGASNKVRLAVFF